MDLHAPLAECQAERKFPVDIWWLRGDPVHPASLKIHLSALPLPSLEENLFLLSKANISWESGFQVQRKCIWKWLQCLPCPRCSVNCWLIHLSLTLSSPGNASPRYLQSPFFSAFNLCIFLQHSVLKPASVFFLFSTKWLKPLLKELIPPRSLFLFLRPRSSFSLLQSLDLSPPPWPHSPLCLHPRLWLLTTWPIPSPPGALLPWLLGHRFLSPHAPPSLPQRFPVTPWAAQDAGEASPQGVSDTAAVLVFSPLLPTHWLAHPHRFFEPLFRRHLLNEETLTALDRDSSCFSPLRCLHPFFQPPPVSPYIALFSVLLSWSRWALGVPCGQEFILSPFWQLEVWSQPVSRALLPLKALEGVCLVLPSWLLVTTSNPWCCVPWLLAASLQSLPPYSRAFFFLSIYIFTRHAYQDLCHWIQGLP